MTVHQARVHEFDAVRTDSAGKVALITQQPFAQPLELRPISIQPDAEQAGRHGSVTKVIHDCAAM